MTRSPTAYYYANGRRVPLQPETGWIAVDLKAAQELVEGQGAIVFAKVPRGPQGIAIVQRSEVPEAFVDALREMGALRPVFRHEDSLLIVLPEVRVEGEKRQIDRALRALEDHDLRTLIERLPDNRASLRPEPDRDFDALAIANLAYEAAKLRMAEPRFLRVVKRRDGQA